MVENNIGTFTMYDASSGEFYKPEENGDYGNSSFTVSNWNTWMRAVAYWLRDKFDFDISSGSGKSLGLIGPHQGETKNLIIWPASGPTFTVTERLENKIGLDNDWTEERSNGAAYIEGEPVPINPAVSLEDTINEWQELRAESPFNPCQENGNWYYSNDGTDWTGKWLGTEIFDDDNNRFDIILSHSNFNNLGLRIKYPLTTTGVKSNHIENRFVSTAGVTGDRDSGNQRYYRNMNSGSFNLTITNPGAVPIINKTNILKNEQAFFYIVNPTNGAAFRYFRGTYGQSTGEGLDENINYGRFYCHKGFVTILNGKNNEYCCGQQWCYGPFDKEATNNLNNQSYNYFNLTYPDKSTNKSYSWTPDFINHIDSKCTFNYSAKNFNKIRYIKSCDENENINTLLISITDSNERILLQFCLYKDINEKSNLIIAEDSSYSRTYSPTWKPEGDKKYWNYSLTVGSGSTFERPSHQYGNYGNIIANSDGTIIPTPMKKYYDARDNKIEAIEADKEWILESYCPTSEISAYGKSLYIVKRAGSEDLISKNGKFIITSINGKVTKLIVVPFNGDYTKEINKTDTSYLIAIPIEQED